MPRSTKGPKGPGRRFGADFEFGPVKATGLTSGQVVGLTLLVLLAAL